MSSGEGEGDGDGDSRARSGGSENEEAGIDAAVLSLRTSLRPSYPEIDRLCSDAYLATVLSVPDRTYEYARDEKIAKALAWRREYGVDALMAAFRCDEDGGGVFRRIDATERRTAPRGVDDRPPSSLFVPSQYLVDVCLSGAFTFAGIDGEGRGILRARTALLDWWRTGVDDGIRYHVLVIEHTLRMMRESNNVSNDAGNSETKQTTSEAVVLYIDTSDLSLIPPPMGALTGMARLMQRAYPDRIHRMYVGPVNPILKQLFDLISPYLRPRSRDKIVLMECAPNRDAVEQIS